MFGVDVVAVRETAGKLAGGDASLAGDDELLDGAVGLAGTISALEVTLAHVLAELDQRGTCEREAGLGTGAWLARESGWPRSRAQRPVAVGRRLRALSVIDEAVVDGRLTVEHAAFVARRATVRAIDAVAVVQDQIVAWAADCSFEVWARQVAALIELLDEDGGHDPERDDPHDELHLAPTSDGVVFLKGQFAGADAVVVRQTLEAKADELFHRFVRDRDETGGTIEVPSRSVLMAQAMTEICELANARDVGSSKPARPDVTLIVRASAPLDTDRIEPDDDGADDVEPDDVEPDGIGPDSGGRVEGDEDDRREGGDPCGGDDPGYGDEHRGGDDRREGDPGRSLLVPGADPPVDGPLGRMLHPDGPDPSMIPVPLLAPLWPAVTDLTGVRLQDATTRALLCDATLHALIVDDLGTPLDLGRGARFANDDQRRALRIRDGGCVFPGCDRPPGWCDAHHTEPYEAGGLTDLALLALLCRRHHGISHRRGWTMHATPDGWFWWRAPNGHTFWSQRHGHRRTGPTPELAP